MRISILYICLLSASLITAGCGSQPKNGDGTNHVGMDHNTMPMNVSNTAVDHSKMDHSAMPNSANAESAPYDLQFLDTMIAHHQGAVEMAIPAAAKAGHTEIKTLAAGIIASQQKEIADMKSWREKWFAGAAPAVNMNMAGMSDSMKGMDMKKLSALTGYEYDLEFIAQMVPHHEGAVTMAKEALQKTTRDEVRLLAVSIIKAQDIEIRQMKDWQTAWNTKK